MNVFVAEICLAKEVCHICHRCMFLQGGLSNLSQKYVSPRRWVTVVIEIGRDEEFFHCSAIELCLSIKVCHNIPYHIDQLLTEHCYRNIRYHIGHCYLTTIIYLIIYVSYWMSIVTEIYLTIEATAILLSYSLPERSVTAILHRYKLVEFLSCSLVSTRSVMTMFPKNPKRNNGTYSTESMILVALRLNLIKSSANECNPESLYIFLTSKINFE